VKKGFVALLLVLAVVVLISPAIVGHLAERSMDESLDWAASERQELVVTSQGFDRGWFSSEGQHRVEVGDGELQEILLALASSENAGALPAVIIDTHLDHGLIPLASMTRDQGTLMPGLGSAISTVSVELADGEVVQLPGTIYSNVGLTGELRSKFVLEEGNHNFAGAGAKWGKTTVEVTTDPANSRFSFDGDISSLAMAAEGDFVSINEVTFAGDQRKSRFGFPVGDAEFALLSISVEERSGVTTSFGPLSIKTTSQVDGDRVTGKTTIDLENTPFGELGTGGLAADISIIEADATAIGAITDALDDMRGGGSQDDFMFVVQNDLQRLLAEGFELRFDRLDFSLPQGTLTSKLVLVVDESDPDTFTWTSALLALDATFELSMPTELVDLFTAMDPQMHAAIAGGFIRKNGEVYEMEAAFKNGLLTVNGAPMPIPIPGLQSQ